MCTICEACSERPTWHPQLHLVTSLSSGCVDEELAPLLEACADLRLPVLPRTSAAWPAVADLLRRLGDRQV